jgi:hypothetical protein
MLADDQSASRNRVREKLATSILIEDTPLNQTGSVEDQANTSRLVFKKMHKT